MEEKKSILVISFGTSWRDTCEKTIGAIEDDLKEAFRDRTFYRAWTSRFIRKKIKEQTGEEILSPEEALQLVRADADVLIQPTHLLAGGEFEKIEEAIRTNAEDPARITIGRPLLETEDDIRAFAKVLQEQFADVKEEEMAVFMGHGSDSLALPVYDLLNEAFQALGCDRFCVGTVECSPGIEPVLKRVRERKPETVYLSPLLVVAGDHANKDMAGDAPDSWKNQIAKEGPEVRCILKGLGEYPLVRALYVKRAKEAACSERKAF